MDRPKRSNYVYGVNPEFNRDKYISDLNKYCDELEEKLSKGDCISHYEKKIQQLEKALDKACDTLAEFHQQQLDSDSYTRGYRGKSKQQWKRWCLKDDN